jgi:3-hydroxyisobutyrate dehydrogenase-like beta-hydroxyacid dehydrogenase
MNELQPVTILGAGALGAVVARAFATAGHRTTVWNRTPGRVHALRDEIPALRAAETVPEAISAGELVVLVVADSDAARAVVEAAGDTLAGRLVVSLTSTTPADSRALATLVGTRFLDGAAMSGGSAEEVATVATQYLPFATGLVTDHARQLDARTYPADDGSLTVYAGAVRHLVATAAERGVATDIADAWRTVIDRAVAAGHGEDGLAALTEVLR